MINVVTCWTSVVNKNFNFFAHVVRIQKLNEDRNITIIIHGSCSMLLYRNYFMAPDSYTPYHTISYLFSQGQLTNPVQIQKVKPLPWISDTPLYQRIIKNIVTLFFVCTKPYWNLHLHFSWVHTTVICPVSWSHILEHHHGKKPSLVPISIKKNNQILLHNIIC